jgi:hypothetical protein
VNVLVTLLDLRVQLRDVRVDLVALRHDETRRRARQVVEDCRTTIVVKDVAERHDRHLIDRRDRPLRRWIVGAHRLDRVADELQPDGERVTGWKDVGDSSADREFARLVGGIFAREARVHQTLRQVDG